MEFTIEEITVRISFQSTTATPCLGLWRLAFGRDVRGLVVIAILFLFILNLFCFLIN